MPRHDSRWWPLRARGLLDELIEFPHDRAEPPKKSNKGQHPLATRIMSNGVGVIVADANNEEQVPSQKTKLLRGLPSKPMSLSPSTLDNNVRITVTTPEKQTNNSSNRYSAQLLATSTSIATDRNTRHPILQLKHNYVIKTCFTTFTYLTTLMRKSRTIISTYETVVSTVTTEPLVITPTLTQFNKNTKQNEKSQNQFQATQLVQSTMLTLPKIEKRIDDLLQNLVADDDDEGEDEDNDIIQPSEVSPSSNSCSMTSCPCTVTLTESLKNTQIEDVPLQLKRSPLKSTKYGSTVIDIAPTSVTDHKSDKYTKKPNKNSSDKLQQKYTSADGETSNDDKNKTDMNLDEKQNGTRITDDKRRPQNANDKNKEPPKPNKTKFQVADLLKLGTLGIKKLAPMIEQMTGTLKKRQEELNKQTFKPATTITPYIVNKRIDSIDTVGTDQKPINGKFPIYIPVDEDLETAESQNAYVNSTLHQNLLWASQNLKNSRNNIAFGKPVHESPLLNGGIPISPGEIITANSDVIVGKPAVGGPNIQEIKPHPENQGQSFLDSHSQSSNFQDTRSRPPQRGQGLKHIPFIREDDSYDLRPPMMPLPKPNLPPPHQQMNQQMQINQGQHNMHHGHHQVPLSHSHEQAHHHHAYNHEHNQHHQKHHQRPEMNGHIRHPQPNAPQDQIISENRPIGRPIYLENDKPHDSFVDHIGGSIHPPVGSENHGRPAFLDYIPSLGPEEGLKNNLITRKNHEDHGAVANNLDKIRPTPSKSWHSENKVIPLNFDENVRKPVIKEAPEPILLTDLVQKSTVKPFLVDIQPSRVANVIIPHGSSTALIFSGNSEPHKNGEYIDDPLPYSEPGYFGSFSIDAPHLTSVHVGGKMPVNQRPGGQHSNDQRIPPTRQTIRDNIPSRNNPEPSIISHGISGLNQNGKPPSGHRWVYDDANPSKNFRGPPPGNLPPPISKQEQHIHFGPQRPNKPDHHVINMNFGPDVNIPPPVGNLHYNEGSNKIKTTTADYEADLAVPPPPPPTVQVKFESNVGVLNSEYERVKNGGNNVRPQDNVPQGAQQRPFSHNNDNVPPRVTSEVYFASQVPNGDRFSQKLPSFSVDLPDPSKNIYRPHQNNIGHAPETVHFPSDGTKFFNTFDGGLVTLNAGTKVNIPSVTSGHVDVSPLRQQNNVAPGVSSSHFTIPQQGGLITLNAGASVHGVNFPEQTISGTSISSPGHHQIANQINHHEIKQFNSHIGESTGIPIGTNVAIKVEPQHIQSYEQNIQVGVPTLPTAHGINEKGPEIIVGGNSWKAGPSLHDSEEDESNGNIHGIPDSVHNGNEKVHVIHASTVSEYNITHIRNSTPKPNIQTIHNSHANFPKTKESEESSSTTLFTPTRKPFAANEIPKGQYSTQPSVNKIDTNIAFMSNQHAGFSHPQQSYIEIFDKYKQHKSNNDAVQNQHKTNNDAVQNQHKSNNDAVQNQHKTNNDVVQNQHKTNNNVVYNQHKSNNDVVQNQHKTNNNVVYNQHNINANRVSNIQTQSTTERQTSKPLEKEKPNIVNEIRFGDNKPSVPSPPSISYNWETMPKPFEKPILKPKPTVNTFSSGFIPPPHQTYNPSYIPTHFENHQPAYNIPSREETKPQLVKNTPKPVFTTTRETSKPINVFINQNKGEVSAGSAKVPTFTAKPIIVSNEVTVNYNVPINRTTYSVHDNKIFDNKRVVFNADDNSGSQTEEPFDRNKYTIPGSISVTQNPITHIYGQLVPRPFTPKDQEDNIVDNVRVDMPNPRPFRKHPQFEYNGDGQIKVSTPSTVTTEVTARRPTVSENNLKTTKRPQKTTSYYNYQTEQTPSSTKRPIRTRPTTTKPTTVIDITTKANNDSIMISNLSPPPPTNNYSFKPTGNDEEIMGMSPPPKTPLPKLGNEYSTYSEISTYRPTHNPPKNQYRRPTDYYRITTRPFTRHTTPSTIRSKPSTGTTTITRLVYTSRSTAWRNPIRGETQSISSVPIILPTAVEKPSVINTQPNTVGPDIMHPDTYPEENIGFVSSSVLPNHINPDRVVPHIYSTAVRPSGQLVLAPSIISAPSVVYRPSVVQSSEKFHNDFVNKETEVIKPALTISLEESSRKPSKTLVHKFTVPPNQQNPSKTTNENKITLRPVHHAGNEIKQSDDYENNLNEKVTAVTYTTTLSEPASTVLTTKFVTLTHTLTVTQTKTSVVSPVIDSTTQTQTLVLTNTQTSTIVDVVTEIHTLVQPTTIVQTITKHVPITTLPSWETKYPKVPIEPTQVRERPYKTQAVIKLDDVSLSSDEEEFIIRPDENEVLLNTNATSGQEDNDTFFVVMNKSQNGGSGPNLPPILEDDDFDGATRNEEINNDGVSHVMLGEILLAGTPYMENGGGRTGPGYGKECQPECQASRNERCQRTHGLMRCVCRPGFARMFPDRPCKPTYTYSMKLALSRYGRDRLLYQDALADQSSQAFQTLAEATHEGINRMVMQSDLRDVYHGVHVNGFLPVTIPAKDGSYTGVVNDFYVQLSDNAHENRLKEVVEKYLRTNNYSLGGSEIYAAGELVDKLEVGDFNECASIQFHDCSEHAECFNLRASYTCSCREGFADISPNPLYPGRMCSAEAVGCEKCHYHGTCYNRDSTNESILCECFQWYSGDYCQINLKVILISLSTLGALLFIVLLVCLVLGCARRRRTRPHPMMAACLAPHQSTMQSSKHHSTLDKRALIQERGNDSGGEGSSVHNAPYVPSKKVSQISQKSKRSSTQESSEKGKPFTVMIPRAKYCPGPTSPLESSKENTNSGRRKSSSGENTAEAKLLNYLEGGSQDPISRRKQSNESSYSMNQSGMPKKYSTGALVSAGFKVSTTVTEEVRVNKEPNIIHDEEDDVSSITKSHTLATIDMQSQYNSLRKAYSNEDMNDWTDAERRIGELTMSEARSFDGTLVKPAQKLMRSTTGSNKSSAHYTQHEANTMAERDLGSTFLLPHVHLYKPEIGSDVSEFDSL